MTLTPRQYDVLERLALGRTYAEAAIDLGVSKQTIKRTVNDTYARLGVTCLAEALLSVGWLSVPVRPSEPLALVRASAVGP